MSEQQQVAIVSGASSGVGQATARLLAQAGYAVVMVARRPEPLEAAAQQIREQLDPVPTLEAVAADVTDPQAVRRVVDAALTRFGRIDAVANIAGNAPLLPIEEVTEQIWRQCIDTNLSAVVHMTAAVWPVFRKQQRGVIVNVSSMSSIDPFPGFAIYAAAKVGVNMFTKCTADEGSKLGVQAVAIAPGAVETPLLRKLFSEEDIPREKALPPEAVAEVIRDCVTGHRAFEPGETLVVASP